MTANHPHAASPRLVWLGLCCALVVAGWAAATRYAVLREWQAAPETYFVDGRPVMTTADAYYSLRWAQAWLDGRYEPHADDPLRLYQRLQYPRGVSVTWPGDAEREWLPQRQPRELPLLSRLIAWTTPLAGSVELAALYLTPILAVLFVLPLYGYAARLGEPAAGLLAGLVAAAAPIYFSRTGLGDVDTDCLNLFFPWLAAFTLVCIRPRTAPPAVFCLAAVLGLVLYGYYRWYDKPALSLFYWGALVAVLLAQRRAPGLVVAACVVCVFTSHPDQFALCVRDVVGLFARYVGGGNPLDGASAAGAWFPNVMNTIGEFRSQGWRANVDSVLRPTPLPLLGLAAFGLFACRRWRDCLPLVPLLVMAAFTFVSGVRFAIYLAPFVGLGLGLAVSWGVRRAFARDTGGGRDADRSTLVCIAAVLLVFALGLKPLAATQALQRPIALPAELQRGLQAAAARMPPAAPVWTWWDYGFALEHLYGFAVYHDGAGQYTPQTNVIAWSLMTDDPLALSRTMDFIDEQGNRGLDALAKSSGSREAMLEALASAPMATAARRPKYLLFTSNMLDAASALQYAAGLPTTLPDGTSLWFEPLPCLDLRQQTLHCDGFDVDLRSGRFSDGRSVRRFVIVDGGEVVKALDFDDGGTAVLQLVIGADRRIRSYRVPETLYRSNLNRMFVLGEYDRARFEEISQVPGRLRLFRQKF